MFPVLVLLLLIAWLPHIVIPPEQSCGGVGGGVQATVWVKDIPAPGGVPESKKGPYPGRPKVYEFSPWNGPELLYVSTTTSPVFSVIGTWFDMVPTV